MFAKISLLALIATLSSAIKIEAATYAMETQGDCAASGFASAQCETDYNDAGATDCDGQSSFMARLCKQQWCCTEL